MANKYRGEREITLGTKTYTMRPTFSAMVEFEDRVGLSTYEVMQNIINKQSLPLKVATAAIWTGVKAAWPVDSRPPTFDAIGEAVMKVGLPAVMQPVLEYLADALTPENAKPVDGDEPGKA